MTLSRGRSPATSSGPVADFRDKTIVAFDRKAVTGIDLDVDGDRFALAADEAGKWQVAKPGPYRADADVIADFLDKLESAKAKEFAAAGDAAGAATASTSRRRVTLWIGKDKDRASKTLLVRQGGRGEEGRLREREGDAAG